MVRCAACQNTVGQLGDLHACTGGELKFCLAAGPVAPHAAAATTVPFTTPLGTAIRTPAVSKKSAGRFTVSGWLALALVALAAVEAGAIVALFKHQIVVIDLPSSVQIPRERVKVALAPYFNYSLYGGWPPCGVMGNVCWTSI